MFDVQGGELVEQFRRANARLREIRAVKDAEIEALRVEKDPQLAELFALVKAQGLRIAELERRAGSGSHDSGTPTSKELIAAKADRKVSEERGGSSRQRSADRSRGGQPEHVGWGLVRDPNPTRLADRRARGGFAAVMLAALLAEAVLTADESPVECCAHVARRCRAVAIGVRNAYEVEALTANLIAVDGPLAQKRWSECG